MAAFNKILVPHEVSNPSDRALEYAVKIAGEDRDAEIILMHVNPSIPAPILSASSTRIRARSKSHLHDIYELLQSNADKILLELKKDWTGNSGPAISTHVVIGGNVAQRLVEYAKDHAIDLIVINSRSTLGSARTRLKFWMPLGSVSRAVSEIAPCPVMLVRPVAEQRSIRARKH